MLIDWQSFKKCYSRPKGPFFPVGTRVYKGHQGKGKTMSAVHDIIRIYNDWSRCQVFSNVNIKGLDPSRFHFVTTDEEIMDALYYEVKDGCDGCVVFIDEAHIFFNKRTGISPDVLTAISQERKDKRLVYFTSQIWEELDISVRKQVKEIVNCHSFFHIQFNSVFNGHLLRWSNLENCYTAPKIRTEIFHLNKELDDCYDTYAKIRITNADYHRDIISSNNISISNNTKKKKGLFTRSSILSSRV